GVAAVVPPGGGIGVEGQAGGQGLFGQFVFPFGQGRFAEPELGRRVLRVRRGRRLRPVQGGRGGRFLPARRRPAPDREEYEESVHVTPPGPGTVSGPRIPSAFLPSKTKPTPMDPSQLKKVVIPAVAVSVLILLVGLLLFMGEPGSSAT